MGRILVLDGDVESRALLDAHVAPRGHTLVSVADGSVAAAAVRDCPPDLIVVDLELGGAAVRELLQQVLGTRPHTHIPVVGITAPHERSERIRMLQAGVDDLLPKPIDEALFVARVRSLLDLKHSRDALEARNAALEQARRDQEELVQFVVHDLRGPLSVILLNLRWSIKQLPAVLSSNVIVALNEANDAALRLRGMIDDLLVVSRLEHASRAIEKVPLDTAELLRSSLAFAYRRAREHAIAVTLECDLGCSAALDAPLMRRVVENIVDNALRFVAARGSIAVKLRGLAQTVVITIANDGLPIPVAERERIFDKFMRGGPEPASPGAAGLGLYFCKRVIEAHGGTIHVTQTPEWPTVFEIQLPRLPS